MPKGVYERKPRGAKAAVTNSTVNQLRRQIEFLQEKLKVEEEKAGGLTALRAVIKKYGITRAILIAEAKTMAPTRITRKSRLKRLAAAQEHTVVQPTA